MVGVVWVMKNLVCDVVEFEDLLYEELLCLCFFYFGDLIGVYIDWILFSGCSWLFDEDIDFNDFWQFKNFCVG